MSLRGGGCPPKQSLVQLEIATPPKIIGGSQRHARLFFLFILVDFLQIIQIDIRVEGDQVKAVEVFGEG